MLFREKKIAKLTTLSLLIGMGLILFVFESLLPRPLPWAKPGLANIVSVLALYWFGIPAALLVAVGRTFLGALIVGTFLSPGLLLSLGGALTSVLVMGAIRTIQKDFLSMIGISIVGAFSHTIMQFILARWLIVGQSGVFYLLPPMMAASIVTGLIIGICAFTINQRLSHSGFLQ